MDTVAATVEASPKNTSVQQLSNHHDPVKAHILHLSDLHFGTKEDGQLWAGQLADDLKLELNCPKLDAMIISGDIANLSVKEEYDEAQIFIERISAEFGLTSEKLIIVPGNHDLNWDLSEDSYNPMKLKKITGKLEEGSFIVESDTVVQIRDDDAYKNRFFPFSVFYEDITKNPYPLEPAGQGIIYHLKDLNLLVLGLNSAWQVDHHFKRRAGICSSALGAALDTIRNNSVYSDCMKFAVWHHPLDSSFDDRITDGGFLERLAQSGFSICFHGHLHKSESGLFRYDRCAGGRKIEIVGAGTFGAPTKDWYSGYQLQYNLLKITQRQITVETRCCRKINGAWGPDAIWSQGPGKDPLPRYVIDLSPRETVASQPMPSSTPPLVEIPTLASPHKGKSADPNLETDIRAYCRSADALYETLPRVGFRTWLRVPIRIEEIYIPLRAMMDLRATGFSCFHDS